VAIYKVINDQDELLRRKAHSVNNLTPNILKLLDNMKDTMYYYQGVGLAAPQIGVSKRVIVVDVGEGPIEVVNPVIVESEGLDEDTEGCLSVPGIAGEVPRYTVVTVTGLDRQGQEVRQRAEGFLARVFQHEIDHLEGILFTDKAKNLRKD
jgi:peptide deformylase